MNPDDLARILDELGQRLGPSGEYVFALAVREQLITGWVIAAICGLFGLVAVVSFVVGLVQMARSPNDSDSGGVAIAASLLTGFGFVVVLVVFLAAGITKLLNPEYAALRDLLSAIR